MKRFIKDYALIVALFLSLILNIITILRNETNIRKIKEEYVYLAISSFKYGYAQGTHDVLAGNTYDNYSFNNYLKWQSYKFEKLLEKY